MICPNCQTLVADSAAICDHCNHILDASFLGGDITNEGEQGEPAAEPTRIKAMPAAAPATRGASGEPAAKPAGRRKASEPATVQFPSDDDEATAAGARRATLDEVAAPPAAASEALEDLAAQFRALSRSEQLSAGGAALLLVSLALPWRTSLALGDDIGMLTSAWPLTLVPFAVVAVLVARRHPRLHGWRDRLLQAATGLGALALVGILAFMRSALVVERVRAGKKMLEQAASWPAFGVYLGLVAALLVLGGAVKTWLDRDHLPA